MAGARPSWATPRPLESTYFLSTNRNKESITLDLKDAADKDVLLRLVDRADVLVENFRTGVLDRLGLGIESLQERNPRLVVLSITGFGHDGPEGGRAGYDQIAQGEAGLMSLTGSGPDDPQRVGTPIADLLAGMYGAYGVRRRAQRAAPDRPRHGGPDLAARRRRRRARLPGHPLDRGRRGRPRAGQPPPSIAPYGLFHCRDGSVQIAVGQRGPVAQVLRRVRARPRRRGAGHATGERIGNRDRVIELVEAAFADRDAEPLLAELAAAGIPAGKVRTLDEVYAWDQTLSQGLLVDVEHPTLGGLRLPGPPLRFFDGDGAETTRRDHGAPPTLDQHGQSIRAWLEEDA